MPEILVLAGLVIGTLLYFLLVRRRETDRVGVLSMHRALAASNEIALERMRAGLRKPDPQPGHVEPAAPEPMAAEPMAPEGPSQPTSPEQSAEPTAARGDWRDDVIVADRRGGADRRDFDDRRRGRGRRTGAERRRK